jgi:hypothetical protein
MRIVAMLLLFALLAFCYTEGGWPFVTLALFLVLCIMALIDPKANPTR